MYIVNNNLILYYSSDTQFC